jgi:hypothetical protein
MKRKLLIVCAFAGMGTLATAQTTEVKNDRGQIVTPEAGDWALGMNGAPILNYVGNMFNGNTSNSVATNSFVSGNAIYGKYFTDASTAYRASIGFGSFSNKNTVHYGGATGDSLVNTRKLSGFPVNFSVGIEKRKGHGRLQGYYGGEFMFGLAGVAPKSTYTYAVEFDSTSFNNGTLVDYNGTPIANNRIESTKGGNSISFGVRGFIGVEYFVAPKFSIGAEYGLGLRYVTTSAATSTMKTFNATTGAVEDVTMTTAGKTSGLTFATDNFAGAIRFMYHF